MDSVTSADALNGIFELIGSLFMWKNVLQLLKDKQVRGSYWPAWGFFAAWGLWNMAYYPCIGQWYSFAGGIAMALGNVVWCVLAWKYRKA